MLLEPNSIASVNMDHFADTESLFVFWSISINEGFSLEEFIFGRGQIIKFKVAALLMYVRRLFSLLDNETDT